MKNFQDTFETRKSSFISAFSVCMTVSLNAIIFLPIEINPPLTHAPKAFQISIIYKQKLYKTQMTSRQLILKLY